MMNGFASEFRNFWARPFSADMDAKEWFLLVGFVIVCAVVWQVILFHLLTVLRNAAD